MTKFNVGDRVVKARRYSNDEYCRFGGEESVVPIGTRGEVVRTIDGALAVKFDNDCNWSLDETELDLESKSKVKIQPIEKHLILQDSCGNFIAIKNSEKEAIEYAKGYNKEDLTIYKLIEVVKISTERKVSRVKSKKKNGRSNKHKS